MNIAYDADMALNDRQTDGFMEFLSAESFFIGKMFCQLTASFSFLK